MANLKNSEKRFPITVNILSRLRFEASPVGKTTRWILTIGKAGVLFTFAIIAIALIYRITLDRKVEFSREKIKRNVDTIKSYSEMESRIRSIDKKLAFIQELPAINRESVVFFQKVESNLPKEINIETLNIDYQNGSLQLRGEAANEIVFSQMMNAFSKQDEYAEISIDQLQSGGAQNPNIKFTMNIILANSEK